jgi:deazaflavin-dependent oxidoreductase (nitroreductase family)
VKAGHTAIRARESANRVECHWRVDGALDTMMEPNRSRRGGVMSGGLTVRRGVAWLLGGVVLGYLLFSLVMFAVWRSRRQPAIDALRRFNKKLNPVRLRSAGKRGGAWAAAAIHHTGRKSGREYATPVWAHRVGQAFYIGLPYGTNVDWGHNVLAAGGCTIESGGVCYDTVSPAIVPAEEAAPQLPGLQRRMLGLMGVDSYLRLDIVPAEESVESAD